MYVIPDVPQETVITAWKVWQHRVVPSFALEVVADHRRFQLFRRTPRRGFGLVLATDGDRVQARSLGCWIRAVGEGASLRLRLAEGRAGRELDATDAERAERAEAEIAELRAQVARLRKR